MLYNVEQLREKLLEKKIPIKQVAREAGLHYHTVRGLLHQKDKNPSIRTVEKLSNYFNGE